MWSELWEVPRAGWRWSGTVGEELPAAAAVTDVLFCFAAGVWLLLFLSILFSTPPPPLFHFIANSEQLLCYVDSFPFVFHSFPSAPVFPLSSFCWELWKVWICSVHLLLTDPYPNWPYCLAPCSLRLVAHPQCERVTHSTTNYSDSVNILPFWPSGPHSLTPVSSTVLLLSLLVTQSTLWLFLALHQLHRCLFQIPIPLIQSRGQSHVFHFHIDFLKNSENGNRNFFVPLWYLIDLQIPEDSKQDSLFNSSFFKTFFQNPHFFTPKGSNSHSLVPQMSFPPGCSPKLWFDLQPSSNEPMPVIKYWRLFFLELNCWRPTATLHYLIH